MMGAPHAPMSSGGMGLAGGMGMGLAGRPIGRMGGVGMPPAAGNS